MAVRSEELAFGREANVVYRFPIERARARALRADRLQRTKAVGAVAVVIVAVLAAGGPASVSEAGRTNSPRSIVVEPGDTLWELAERYAPSSVDPRAWIDSVAAMNRLEGPLQAGERLRLPR